MSGLREQVLQLGPTRGLVAIATHPASAPQASRPAVVILNAGIIHRVGPNRLHVELARRLAAEGHVVVRLDLSGIGDSERRRDGLPPLDAVIADIGEALDSLQTGLGLQRVILLGLCSGADHAVIYAGADTRVAGVVLLDPNIPRTAGYYFFYYGRRLWRLGSWGNLFTGRHPVWKRLRRRAGPRAAISAPEALAAPDVESSAGPDHAEVRAFLTKAYARTVAGGCQMLAVLTGLQESQHTYRKQLLHAFPTVPFGSQLQLEYMSNADHTFEAGSCRSELFELIAGWVNTTHFAVRK